MRERPWLSVLVPVYNVQDYLGECIASLMPQLEGVPGVQVLLLDDASSDGSAALAQQLQARWPGALQLLRHPHNQGLSAARNSLLAASSGAYIWFLDSDDFLQPGAIASLRQAIQSHAPDLVLCDFSLWRAQPRLKHRLRGEAHRRSFHGPARTLLRDRTALLQGMLLGGQMHAWSKIARRELWQGLQFPPGAYFEDMATMPRLLLRARSAIHVPEPWVAYRQRAGSILSGMNAAKAADLSRALRPFVQDWRHCAQAEPQLASDAMRFAIAHLAARNYLGALRALQRAAPPPAQAQALARQFAQDYLACSPLPPAALLHGYLRRGWLLRYARTRQAVLAAPAAAQDAARTTA